MRSDLLAEACKNSSSVVCSVYGGRYAFSVCLGATNLGNANACKRSSVRPLAAMPKLRERRVAYLCLESCLHRHRSSASIRCSLHDDEEGVLCAIGFSCLCSLRTRSAGWIRLDRYHDQPGWHFREQILGSCQRLISVMTSVDLQ